MPNSESGMESDRLVLFLLRYSLVRYTDVICKFVGCNECGQPTSVSFLLFV
jgi:hypothetical protein